MSYTDLIASLEDIELEAKDAAREEKEELSDKDAIKTDDDLEAEVSEQEEVGLDDSDGDVIEHGDGVTEANDGEEPSDDKEDDVQFAIPSPDDGDDEIAKTKIDIAVVEDAAQELEEVQATIEAMKEHGLENVPDYAKLSVAQRLSHVSARTGLSFRIDTSAVESYGNADYIESMENMLVETAQKIWKWLKAQYAKVVKFLADGWKAVQVYVGKVFSKGEAVRKKVADTMPDTPDAEVKTEYLGEHGVTTYREWAEKEIAKTDNVARVQALSFSGKDSGFRNPGESLTEAAANIRTLLNGFSQVAVSTNTSYAKGFPEVSAEGNELGNAIGNYCVGELSAKVKDMDGKVVSPSGLTVVVSADGVKTSAEGGEVSADALEPWLSFFTDKNTLFNAMKAASKACKKAEEQVNRSAGSIDKILKKVEIGAKPEEGNEKDTMRVLAAKEYLNFLTSMGTEVRKIWGTFGKDYNAFIDLAHAMCPQYE